MENLLIIFQASLKRLGVTKKDRLLLAVSGGLDSIVLTACCAMLKLNFSIAHANFQLRGPESDRDEMFVRALADKLLRPFFLKKFETEKMAADLKLSIQATARNLRYDWFQTLTESDPGPFDFVVTAHHLNDNIETMLMHFFRGTGIAGLTGMPEKNQKLIRPLLSVSKLQLKKFASEQNLEWVEDSSNALADYTRNYFRNELIPSIEKVFPDVNQNLENNLRRFSETNQLFEQALSKHRKKLMIPNGSEVNIPILLLRKSAPTHTILYEILKDFHFTPGQTAEVIRLMDSSNGKYITSSSHRVIKNRRWLIIAPLDNETVSQIVVDKNEINIRYPEGRLHFNKTVFKESESVTADPSVAWLNADKIQFPLILRKWKSGDYFYPLGMNKKKKIARFLIDQKVSKTAKEKVWVLVMDSQIIWVVGQRIDNRFCITPSTGHVLQIRQEIQKKSDAQPGR